MVTIATFFVGSIFGFAVGIIFTHWLLRLSLKPATKSTPIDMDLKFWGKASKYFTPIPVEPPKDYPVHSIPRTRGSWRKQKSALEAEHNSKQKELDALTGGI